jgi:hypothetical protein
MAIGYLLYGEILFIWVRACAKGAVKVNFSAFSEVFEIVICGNRSVGQTFEHVFLTSRTSHLIFESCMKVSIIMKRTTE